jgi:tungstate transport system ATP-binding protein
MPDRKNRCSIVPIKGQGIRLVREGRTLLDIESIELGKPGVTAILGHNGAGKSLLLKVLTGLVKPDLGTVTWGGQRPTRDAYRRLGYMKQNAVLLRRSARANLEFALGLDGMDRAQARQRADGILKKFSLEAVADTSARLLSGGEKQRLALARMLAGKPEIILLDEPTASLDPVSTRAIEATIEGLKTEGRPMVLVTHDLRQARCLADDIVFLEDARILAHQTATAFFSSPPCREAARFIGS